MCLTSSNTHSQTTENKNTNTNCMFSLNMKILTRRLKKSLLHMLAPETTREEQKDEVRKLGESFPHCL